MLRLRRFALAGCCVALAAALVNAQETDLKDIVRKSIAAQGGEKDLEKYKAGTTKYKGTMHILNQKSAVTAEMSFQKPDKMRNAMTIEIAGNTIELVTVFDGKSFWVSTAGNTMEIKDEKILNEVRESLLVEGGGLHEILKAPYELTAIGDVKVKDKDTIGIRVSKKGQRDISYYFDKKTYLVAKTETRSYDSMTGQEVTQEKFILEYQDKDGMKVGKRVEIQKDGKDFMDIEITEIRMLEKLDDSLFARP